MRVIDQKRFSFTLPSGHQGTIEFRLLENGDVLTLTSADYFPPETRDRLWLREESDRLMLEALKDAGQSPGDFKRQGWKPHNGSSPEERN